MAKLVKKRRVPILVGVGLLLVVALLVLQFSGGESAARAQGSVQSAEAQIGSITTTVTGTGTLEIEGSEAVLIPAGLTVSDVFVDPGDFVTAGMPLARFDLGSVQTQIVAVSEEITELDAEIESVRTNTASTRITAGVAGRVETIYAQVGDLVSDNMIAHGALMVLSMDGGQTLSVTGVSGEIQRIHVSEGSQVRAGATLFTLTGIDNTPEQQALLAQRAERIEVLQTLLSLAQSGTLIASFDGIVESVVIGGEGGAASSSGVTGGLPAELPAGAASFTSNTDLASVDNPLGITRLVHTNYTPEPPSAQVTEITTLSDLLLAPPVTGNTPQVAVAGAGYTGVVQWTPADPAFLPGVEYRATIMLTPNSGYGFGQVVAEELAQGQFPTPGAVVVGVEGMGNMLAVLVAFPATENIAPPPGGDAPVIPDIPGGGIPNMPGASGGMPSFSSSAMPSVDGETLPNMDGGSNGGQVTAFTIAEAEVMALTITIDERDILSLQAGQEAEIRLDAVPDERFHGAIRRVGLIGQSVGGGARYTVEITLPRTAQMLPGMSASAVITTYERAGILLVPALAIQDDGMRVYVYTSVTSDGVFSAPINVQIGVSDGVLVEILQGLTVGDTVYYTAPITSDGDGGFPFGGGGGGPFGGGA